MHISGYLSRIFKWGRLYAIITVFGNNLTSFGGFVWQFFQSRKKKTISPKGKICKTEKAAEPALDQSPSSKRSLDGYLSVNSQFCSQVTRNLLSGASTISDARNDARNEPIAPREAYDDTEKEENVVSSSVPNEDMLPKTSMDQVMEEKVPTDPVNENVEVRQFAIDFLSLHCRLYILNPWLTLFRKHLFRLMNSCNSVWHCIVGKACVLFNLMEML